jgi:hypothetical protein
LEIFFLTPPAPTTSIGAALPLHHSLGLSHHYNLLKLHSTIDQAPWKIFTKGFDPSQALFGDLRLFPSSLFLVFFLLP